MEANSHENIHIKTARTYLICNREDEPLIQFRLILLPTSYVVIDTKILQDEGREILSLSKDANSQLEFNLALERYLETQKRDYKVSGYLLDEFIIDRLQLGQSVLSYGRLKGMEYLIDLLCYHFYDKENELYVTCKEPGTISFFHSVIEWRRLLFDVPVTYKNVKEINHENKMYCYSDDTSRDVFENGYFLEKGTRYLVKFGTLPGVQDEPVLAANEVVASRIANLIGVNVVEYTPIVIRNRIGCVSECFCKRNENIVTAQSIANQLETRDSNKVLQYIRDLGFSDDIDKMILFHTLIGNTATHLSNIALGMDADTMEYTRFIPLYDNGNSFGWNRIPYTQSIMKLLNLDPNSYIEYSDTYMTLPELKALTRCLLPVYKEYGISEEQTQVALQTLTEGYETVRNHMLELEREETELTK